MSLQQVTDVTNGALTIPSEGASVIRGVSIDSRTIGSGELYIAIRGASQDGHNFIAAAESKGAVGALVAQDYSSDASETMPKIVVPDTHEALIQLATNHQQRMTGATAGITGSAGKTAVKEMTRHLLSSAGASVHASAGNLNNLYGLPLSILAMNEEAEYGVFELGISTLGEMSRLAPILRPLVGAITNVSESHLESLGSVAGVRQEKLKLLESLRPDGVAVINGRDTELARGARSMCENVVTFALQQDNDSSHEEFDVTASEVNLGATTGYATFTFEGQRVTLPAFGEEQVANALCAIAICRALGAEVKISSLESFPVTAMPQRGERINIAGIDVIIDCYNANPASMRAGLKTFAALKTKKTGAQKICVIGDMLELGDIEKKEHRALGEYLVNLLSTLKAIDVVITVGKRAQLAAEALSSASEDSIATMVVLHSVDNAHQAGELLSELVAKGDLVYLKASRGIGLERALSALSATEGGSQA